MLNFKKILILTFLIATGVCSSIFADPPQKNHVIQADDSNFYTIIEEHEYCVANFYQDSHDSSKRFQKFFELNSNVFVGKVAFIGVDVNYSYYTVEYYDILDVPTVIFFKNGVEVKRHVGILNMRELYLFVLTGII